MPNRPGYTPPKRDARLGLSPEKQLQDALCRKALLEKDAREHRLNIKLRDEWPADERDREDLRLRVRPAGMPRSGAA